MNYSSTDCLQSSAAKGNSPSESIQTRKRSLPQILREPPKTNSCKKDKMSKVKVEVGWRRTTWEQLISKESLHIEKNTKIHSFSVHPLAFPAVIALFLVRLIGLICMKSSAGLASAYAKDMIFSGASKRQERNSSTADSNQISSQPQIWEHPVVPFQAAMKWETHQPTAYKAAKQQWNELFINRLLTKQRCQRKFTKRIDSNQKKITATNFEGATKDELMQKGQNVTCPNHPPQWEGDGGSTAKRSVHKCQEQGWGGWGAPLHWSHRHWLRVCVWRSH